MPAPIALSTQRSAGLQRPAATRTTRPTIVSRAATGEQVEEHGSRRSILLGSAAMAAALASSVFATPSAKAFGVGFPGYDINLDARKRAQDRNKSEMEAEMKRAAEWRAARDAKKTAATEAPAPQPAAAQAPPAVSASAEASAPAS